MEKWYSLNKLTRYILRGRAILLWRRIRKKMGNRRYQDDNLFFVAVFCELRATVLVLAFEFTYGLLPYLCFSITISDNNWFDPFFVTLYFFCYLRLHHPPWTTDIENIEFPIALYTLHLLQYRTRQLCGSEFSSTCYSISTHASWPSVSPFHRRPARKKKENLFFFPFYKLWLN